MKEATYKRQILHDSVDIKYKLINNDKRSDQKLIFGG